MDKPIENPQPTDGAGQNMAGLPLRETVQTLQTMVAEKQVYVQLHWSEYVQGKWSNPQSGDFVTVMEPKPFSVEFKPWSFVGEGAAVRLVRVPVTLPVSFKPADAFIHISKAMDEEDNEAGVYIHLGACSVQSFRLSFYLAGRNSSPELAAYNANGVSGAKPPNDYACANIPLANRYSGNGGLSVEFTQRMITELGRKPNKLTKETVGIFGQGSDYTLLPCDNNLTALGVSKEALESAASPETVSAASASGLQDIASLIRPVFYQDNMHTLFIEPSVTERTIEEWQEWVVRIPQQEQKWWGADWWRDLAVNPQKPWKRPFADPKGPWLDFEVDSGALVNPAPELDWLVNPGTVLEFDSVLIGPAGQPGLQILTGEASDTISTDGNRLNVNPGSSLAPGSVVVLADADALEQSGLVHAPGGLNVVGNAGLNSALERNFNDLNRAIFGDGVSADGSTRH